MEPTDPTNGFKGTSAARAVTLSPVDENGQGEEGGVQEGQRVGIPKSV